MAIDLTPILDQVISTDIVQGVMLVALNICLVYIVIFGVMNLLAMLRGEEAWSWGLASHLDWFEKSARDREFNRRHDREVKSREYRAWKKSKGL